MNLHHFVAVALTPGRVAALCLAAMFFSGIGGCASTTSQSRAAEQRDDSAITNNVRAAIREDRAVDLSEINVETRKGVVRLSGFVSSQSDINKAVTLTRAVANVKSIKNDMRVK